MTKRVFLMVLDSVGAGAMPDAADWGDAGAGTLATLHKSGRLNIPNLRRLGVGNIDGLDFLGAVEKPLAATARMAELSMGKDTTIGHWEIAGVVSPRPLPTYPDGFPTEVVERLDAYTHRGWLCNKPYSGTEVIKDYGEEHMRTGKLIVYTSADSVLQIAAHTDVVPLEQLYDYCRYARAMMTGIHGVGRIIARPFVGTCPADFTRTGDRHDFSIEAPGVTVLDTLSETGFDSISVGKIKDVFCSRGVTEAYPATCNAESMAACDTIVEKDFHGLCFINLVDFDMLYGHRQDIDGYTDALNTFDVWLGAFLEKLCDDDVLIITADHGCDPGDDSTDHTREYVPMLAYGKGVKPASLGIVPCFGSMSATACELLGAEYHGAGESFAKRIV